MVKFSKRFHDVELKPISDRAKKILTQYPKMLLVEYDELGVPLNICPNGNQGIYCVSEDGFFNCWFELDVDVKFLNEWNKIVDIIDNIGNK